MVAKFQSTMNNLNLHSNGGTHRENIMTIMNKVTTKTLELHSGQVLNCMEQIMTSGTRDELGEHFKFILDISSANKGYNADIYAAIIEKVIGVYPYLSTRLVEFVDSYMRDLGSLSHDSPQNYNQFCALMKLKETRKGSQAIIKNLQICGVLSLDIVMRILTFLVYRIQNWSSNKEKAEKVEELVEHLYLFAMGSVDKLCEQSIWKQTLFPMILALSRLRKRTHGNCGISFKAHFRCMDVVRMQAMLAVRHVSTLNVKG